MTAKGNRVSFLGNTNVLKLIVAMGVQLCIYIQNLESLSFHSLPLSSELDLFSEIMSTYSYYILLEA